MSAPTKLSTPAHPPTPMAALFVSDLHLSTAMPGTTSAFLNFLYQQAQVSQRLYLLGDVFEYWAGDDDLDTPLHQSLISALKSVSDAGVEVFWLGGNRDFLLGDRFAQAAGMTCLEEPYVAEIAEQRWLLLHGDAQCTDDTDYMAFRAQVRDPRWQQAFLARPLAERRALIEAMREGSRDAQRDKAMAIMDVNAQAIDQLFAQYRVTRMIHGHTHRPAVHETEAGIRYVLPDWDCDTAVPRGGWLGIDTAGTVHRRSLPASTPPAE